MRDIKALRTEDLQILTASQAWHYRIVPENSSSNEITFFSDQKNGSAEIKEELELVFGKTVNLILTPTESLLSALHYYYRKEKTEHQKAKNFSPSAHADDFLMRLIQEAKTLGSSDIHIEIYDQRCRVRIRVDGMMIERYVIEKAEYPSLVNKIKILANLDIAEKRLPQDGRIFLNKASQDRLDIRVSVVPVLHGEKVVLRLLNSDATNINIETLGFSDLDLQNYLEGAKRPSGLVLISGPTGSGKTTTLYATLKLLNKSTRNILTIEDPIEYTLEGINQVQLKESIGLNFGSALRTFLRQDPDVIMVGEIRDPETASMAVRASLTGHLVFSTIHTNSAWGTISRLKDIGLEPFLISETLNISVAQRLIRLLCPTCKTKIDFHPSLYPKQFKPFKEVTSHCKATGCENCHYTGYKGRKAVYEVIPIDESFSEDIRNGVTRIKDKLREKKIKTLGENAFELFEVGATSIEEIYPLLLNY
jgi:type IV pilus assembly protein PilB